MEVVKNIKLFVKSAFHLMSRVVLLTAGGTLLNWIYGFSAISPILRQWESGEGVGGFFLSFFTNWHSIAILLLFFAGFPFLWSLMGKAFGVSRALYGIFHGHKDEFLEMFSKLFIKIFEKTKITSEQAAKSSFKEVAKKERLPYWYRVVTFFILDQIELGQIETLFETTPDLQSQKFKDDLKAVLEKDITENYLSPPWLWFFILLSVDIGFMIFVSKFVLAG